MGLESEYNDDLDEWTEYETDDDNDNRDDDDHPNYRKLELESPWNDHSDDPIYTEDDNREDVYDDPYFNKLELESPRNRREIV